MQPLPLGSIRQAVNSGEFGRAQLLWRECSEVLAEELHGLCIQVLQSRLRRAREVRIEELGEHDTADQDRDQRAQKKAQRRHAVGKVFRENRLARRIGRVGDDCQPAPCHRAGNHCVSKPLAKARRLRCQRFPVHRFDHRLVMAENLIDQIAKTNNSISFTVPWLQILVIVVIAYIASLITTYMPAWQASRVYPAEALRYE